MSPTCRALLELARLAVPAGSEATTELYVRALRTSNAKRYINGTQTHQSSSDETNQPLLIGLSLLIFSSHVRKRMYFQSYSLLPVFACCLHEYINMHITERAANHSRPLCRTQHLRPGCSHSVQSIFTLTVRPSAAAMMVKVVQPQNPGAMTVVCGDTECGEFLPALLSALLYFLIFLKSYTIPQSKAFRGAHEHHDADKRSIVSVAHRRRYYARCLRSVDPRSDFNRVNRDTNHFS